MKCIFGVDIGGTNIKIGKFHEGKLVDFQSIKTDTSNKGENILPDVYRTIYSMLDGDELIGIGMGVPGPVVNGVILASHNLGWGEFDVVSKIKEEFNDIVVRVTNDANAATIGEQYLGGGVGYDDFVFLTLGTGIGGGIIMHGELNEGVSGSCGEVGHIRVDFRNLRKCNCGLYDCVEKYASATGIVQTAKELIPGRQTSLSLEDLSSKMIFDEAKKGDPLALEVVDQMVEKLATALSQIANTINPEAFVIGGGVSKAGEFLIEKLQNRFKELAFFSVRDTEFRLATLGNDAGIYGCYYLVEKELKNGN